MRKTIRAASAAGDAWNAFAEDEEVSEVDAATREAVRELVRSRRPTAGMRADVERQLQRRDAALAWMHATQGAGVMRGLAELRKTRDAVLPTKWRDGLAEELFHALDADGDGVITMADVMRVAFS